MASNNFLQWNPNKLNQDNDAQYVLETQRTNGAVSGLFPSVIANKLFYQCSTMAAAMGEMMKNKGFTMSDAVFADLITSLSHILTDAQFGSSAGTVCQGNDPRLDRELPTATKVWFWMNVAPTGWTIDATAAADAVLAVKAGSGTYAVAGGSSAGTWTQPDHIHTVGVHTHTLTGHTHTTANSDVTLPAHTHGISITTSTESVNHTHTFSGTTGTDYPDHTHGFPTDFYSSASYIGTNDSWRYNGITYTYGASARHQHNYSGTTSGISANHSHTVSGTSASTGSGTGTHNHTVNANATQTTSSSGTDNSGASATPNNWRPVANVGIICERAA